MEKKKERIQKITETKQNNKNHSENEEKEEDNEEVVFTKLEKKKSDNSKESIEIDKNMDVNIFDLLKDDPELKKIKSKHEEK